jgi:hypothetical protein
MTNTAIKAEGKGLILAGFFYKCFGLPRMRLLLPEINAYKLSEL